MLPRLLPLLFIWVFHSFGQTVSRPVPPAMYFSDTSRIGKPFAKDPSVVEFQHKFFMYYSLPPKPSNAPNDGEAAGWGIGIASSTDLLHWTKAGEFLPSSAFEQKGIAAPGARVIAGKLHLFYQTYGQGPKDAICHAVSSDGLHFTEDAHNPVYHPQNMPWSGGRAIDAEVLIKGDRLYLYFATRDPHMERQMIGLASAPLNSAFTRGDWTDLSLSQPTLQPELAWEHDCVEAPSVMWHGLYFMFYAGAYNNEPQQIGVARSQDAVHWTRLSRSPFLPNGQPETWNSSESGHPGVLVTHGRTFLFFQGNDNGGQTYYISKLELGWHGNTPYIIPYSSGATLNLRSRRKSRRT